MTTTCRREYRSAESSRIVDRPRLERGERRVYCPTCMAWVWPEEVLPHHRGQTMTGEQFNEVVQRYIKAKPAPVARDAPRKERAKKYPFERRIARNKAVTSGRFRVADRMYRDPEERRVRGAPDSVAVIVDEAAMEADVTVRGFLGSTYTRCRRARRIALLAATELGIALKAAKVAFAFRSMAEAFAELCKGQETDRDIAAARRIVARVRGSQCEPHG